ncbi:sigma-70 family RNA polymerase sigma factor [uncultured Marinobacter sp.]|uniref:sigma-70 family RNA polymerase sigma factor n=1 Tax=uncultured Marinobacter sp. TaxID=187379 RepID=UPI0030DD78F1
MHDEAGQEELIRLLNAVAHQDREAFQALYAAVAGRLFGLCNRLAGQRELAEEALQEAFIRIWHHAGEYHSDRGSPMSWMMTIARYRTLDLMRARKVRQAEGEEVLADLADGRAGPMESSLAGAGNRALAGCIDELSADQRDCLLLSFYRGLTHEELSTTMSTPVGTIKSWVRRGLLALKRCLER